MPTTPFFKPVGRAPEHYHRAPLLLSAVLLSALLALAAAGPALAGSAVNDPGGQVYLVQAQPALADAQSNLNQLQYYLPLASLNDPNDPTWELAQEASDAVRADGDLLETLSPPDWLTQTNADLISALDNASASADSAIAALSGGDQTTGQTDLRRLGDAVATLTSAEASLPQASAVSTAAP